MKFILPIILILCSCELIVIGVPPSEVPVLNPEQTNSLGTGLIFKAEIDTNNLAEAAQFLDSSVQIKAFDRFEKYYWDLEILRNYIKGGDVTLVVSDTIDENQIIQNIEFDYVRHLKLQTFKKDSLWFISNYQTY